MTACRCRLVVALGPLCLVVSVASGPSRAQAAADAPAAAIVGVACLDLDEDGACGATDRPLPDLPVLLSNGLETHTDVAGRFHFAAAGAERVTELDGSLLPRPESVTVSLDASALGPTARPPAPVIVPLTPAAVVPVVLAARLPVRAAPVAPRPAGAPTVRMQQRVWQLELPLALAPGHELQVEGRAVTADAAGVALVPVSLDRREAVLSVVDSAPDGRVTLARLRVLRVPRLEGGALVVTAPLEVLAELDLPPRAAALAPGPLLIPVRAAPGTEVGVAGAHAVVDASGRAWLWARAAPELRAHARRDARVAHAILPLTVDPLVALRARVAGELVAGAVGLTPFAQGRVDASLRLPLGSTALLAGATVDDELLTRALSGRLRLQREASARSPRLADAERDLAVWGDASTTLHHNPGELNLWANARGPWGGAGLGVARTPLDGAEVGRFDRAVVGPWVDAAWELGGVKLGVEAAADAGGVPLVDVVAWRKAHDELGASGGRFYWLSHRPVAVGSARVAVERVDPLTGLVVERRTLEAGRDYELDHQSGRLLLSAPLGLSGELAGTRAGAASLGWQSRLVVDYAHRPAPGEPSSHDGAARLFVEAGPFVTAGVRGALSEDGSRVASLWGADVSAAPLPGLSLSASAARSDGDPFGGSGFGRSADAGLSFAAPPHDAEGGDAVALRARVGGDRSFLSAWGAYRARGFADGALVDDQGAARAGAEGRVELLEALTASALVDAREGRDPSLPDVPDAHLAALDASARLEGRLGIFRLALDGLHRRAEQRVGGAALAGEASAAGVELGVDVLPSIEMYVGHLQRVLGAGEGPGAVDPTLSYLGTRLDVGSGVALHGRVGVHPDLRPEAAASASLDEGTGTTRYGTVAVGSDAPWGGRDTTLVSGARSSLGPATEVYAEDRLWRVTSTTPWQGARVVGARHRPGPLFAGISLQSTARDAHGGEGWRGAVSANAGVSLSSVTLSSFAELVADDAARTLGARLWALGATAQAKPLPDLTLGARALVARGAPLDGSPERPAAELFVGGAWRPRELPDLFAHYSLTEERGPSLLVERLQLGRATVALGAQPGAQLLLAAQLAQHELAERSTSLSAAQALLASTRLTVPVAWFEPTLELGARAVAGAGLDPELSGTARVEAAVRVGPVALGAGVVVIGYSGTGLEELALDPPAPPLYLVVRGALE